jgi:hypothetical protein
MSCEEHGACEHVATGTVVASLCPKKTFDIDAVLAIGGEGLVGPDHDNQTMVSRTHCFPRFGMQLALGVYEVHRRRHEFHRKQANSASIAHRDALIQVCRAGK